jgi:predicted glycoside hydrolase/deacetylase ChbG (UPF0249 family)
MRRILIVNADDFGLSRGVNRGVAMAHEQGIVTSASMMVRGSAAGDAATIARRLPRLSVGLHVDLGEWEYADRSWRAVYEVVPSDDRTAVEAELQRQLDRFHTLVGRGPTHLDSHQHVHRDEPVRSVLMGACAALDVPLRAESGIRYCGEFYGQTGTGEPIPGAVDAASLVTLVQRLPEGLVELGCHPAASRDASSTYRDERVAELAALCDARVRRAIDTEEIELRSFADYPRSALSAATRPSTSAAARPLE